jgi:hypothetical protein
LYDALIINCVARIVAVPGTYVIFYMHLVHILIEACCWNCVVQNKNNAGYLPKLL